MLIEALPCVPSASQDHVVPLFAELADMFAIVLLAISPGVATLFSIVVIVYAALFVALTQLIDDLWLHPRVLMLN